MDSWNFLNYREFSFFYKGNIELLYQPKIAIVGSRKPSSYTKEITAKLSNILSQKFVIVSGGAMGVDAIAHQNAKSTIMVSPAGIDKIYPKINKYLIENIQKKHLFITEYEEGFMPKKYSFLERNRVIVSISEFLIITEADENSGTIRSFEIAKKLNKKVYTIPHKIGESKGSNHLAFLKEVEVIWDIEEFAKSLGIKNKTIKIIDYNEAFRIYGNKLYEMELMGEIEIKDSKVYFL